MGTAAVGHHWQAPAGGRELCGSQPGPGWIYFASHDITSERKEDLEHPPQRHVRKKLVSFIRTNRHQLEWIAFGCTAKLFLDRLAAFDCGAGKSGQVHSLELASLD
jgi:hypothetical protein